MATRDITHKSNFQQLNQNFKKTRQREAERGHKSLVRKEVKHLISLLFASLIILRKGIGKKKKQGSNRIKPTMRTPGGKKRKRI